MKGSLGLLSLQPSTCFCKSLLISSLLTVATSRSHNTPFSPHHIASCMLHAEHEPLKIKSRRHESRDFSRSHKRREKIQFPENAIPVPWHRLQLPFQTKAINWRHRKLKIFIHSNIFMILRKVCNFFIFDNTLDIWIDIKFELTYYKYTQYHRTF